MAAQNDNVYSFKVDSIDHKPVDLQDYAGKVLLIVNVASKCGLTPQYRELQEMYSKYKDRGFEILAFPCNQFNGQEPGTNAEIKFFCTATYSVAFPLFDKIEVNGPGTHPLYQYLKRKARGMLGLQAVKWNFTKFLVNKHGEVIKRYAPATSPAKIETMILECLAEP